MNIKIKPIVAACALALAAGQVGATDVYLVAKAYDKALPDTTTVPMWGYVLDTGDGVNAHCYDIAGAGTFAARRACVEALPAPDLTNPVLAMTPDETQLRVFLTNNLPVHTSIVIPGQELPWSANDNGPTWNDGTTGSRGTDLTKKVRSYGRDANPFAGRRAYIWNTNRANPITDSGTLMYHSGTYPQLQTYMGLFGAVTKDAAAGEVHPGVAYDNEATLIYSEIDPAHNAAVAALDSTYTTTYTPIDFHPSWFLINGEPYEAGVTGAITAGVAGESTLLRFLSAAGEKHVPVIQGMHGTIHAEDGIQYTWQDGATGDETTAPREQYSVGLAPLKTKDVIINPTANGLYAVYDGNGYMTNPSNPDDPADGGDTIGGMLRFLEVGAAANLPPTAVADAATTDEETAVVIDVLANDTDPENDPISLVANDLTGTIAGSSVSCVATTGPCTYTPAVTGVSEVDTFTYTISDGINPDVVGNVTVTINAVNQPPVSVDDAAATNDLTPVALNVLTNDTDPENDPLQIDAGSVVYTGTNGAVSCVEATGDCTYTPNAGTFGVDTFTYLATDGTNVSALPATVSISVTAVPTAVDDAVTTDEGAAVDFNVLANDTDPDTAVLAISNINTTGTIGGVTCDNATGACTYTPAVNFSGPDSFTYTATDGANVSNSATVTVTVNALGNIAPVANADAYSVNEDAVLNVDAAGVLINDTDGDNDALTAVLDTGPSNALSFSLLGDGSFQYIPNVNFFGSDSFTYHANDGLADSNIVTVDITVVSQNDAPIAVADTLIMAAMGSINFPVPSVLANDNDVDLIPYDPSQVFAVRESNPNRGSIPDWPLNGDETTAGADGNFTYNFANGRVGVITSFDYHATDSWADSNTVTVTIRRELSVQKVECENDTENGICKWVIEGRVSARLPNNSTTIEAWLNGFDTGTLVGSVVEQGGAGWNIQVESATIPVAGDTISVRAVHATDPDAANAFILDFPVTIN